MRSTLESQEVPQAAQVHGTYRLGFRCLGYRGVGFRVYGYYLGEWRIIKGKRTWNMKWKLGLCRRLEVVGIH